MRQALIALFGILIFTTTSSQNDTINQRNGKGKKQGYWQVYLDSNAIVTDSAHAFFIGLEYYIKGENVYDFYKEKWKSRDSAVFMGEWPTKGKPIPVSGKFTWYDKKSQMISYEETYKNGAPVKFKEIRYKKKNKTYTWAFIRTHDFEKKYFGVPGSYYLQEQNNQAIYNMEEWANFWYRDGKRGWRKYRVTTTGPL